VIVIQVVLHHIQFWKLKKYHHCKYLCVWAFKCACACI